MVRTNKGLGPLHRAKFAARDRLCPFPVLGAITRAMVEPLIYHMCKAEDWRDALPANGGDGLYRGGPQDRADGFIHFSTAHQVTGSAATHLPGVEGLLLLAVDGNLLGEALVWDATWDGTLFPHLYKPLPVDLVAAVADLPLDADGRHRFPALPESPDGVDWPAHPMDPKSQS